MSAPPRISVVVPVHNAERTLPALLESLATQDIAEPFEVVVSDDASTDRSVAVARGFAGDLPLIVRESPARAGPGPAMNAGAARATTPVLAFCGADDVADAGWLYALCAATSVHPLVAGAVHDLDAPGEPMDPEGLTAYYGHLPWSVGTGLAVRRDAFWSVGGFAEALRTGEDVDLCWRLAAEDVTLAYEPAAVVFKRHRSGALPTFRQYQRYGRDHPLLFRRHRHAGMPRRGAAEAARRYAGTAAVAARAVRHPRSGAAVPAAARLGQDVGRLIGSVRWRSLYL
jgi:glycosyltransferase involved in cell wall biosynthesis